MLAYAYPQVYLRWIFDKKIKCDDESQRKFKTLISASLLKGLQGTRRKDAMIGLARLFEVESEVMESWVEMVLEDRLELKITHMKS